ncbi:MAG: oxidoreductase [Gammaproteobacteria bacterium]|nr:oxidoreductase [Gammaproteobacteria bacterium]
MQERINELGPVSEAIVTDSVRISRVDLAEVRRIRMRVEDPSFRVGVGQSVGVVVPGPHPFGNRYHMRRYSIAGESVDSRGDTEIELLVRRCFDIDEISGESYPGIASNYLCDAGPGQAITLTGPYRSPFRMPRNETANILMIGTGTGVAPFRSFIQEIYRQRGGWSGQVRLYYGARSGMDLLYRNDEEDDLALYYDEPSFQAFRGVISKPLASEADTLAAATESHAASIWKLIQSPDTYVYLAGLGKIAERFDEIMRFAAGSDELWVMTRDRLKVAGRWSELIYS